MKEERTFHYHVFGLTMESAIPFFHMAETEGTPDCFVRVGETPTALPDARAKGVRFQAGPGEFLLQVDNVARYYVTQGKTIIVEPAPGAQSEEVLLFLMGSAMGALLHQRNVLPLHASAIEVDGRGVIFTGRAGIGKSTLAGGFHKRGYPLLSDDVCAVSAGADGVSHIMPGFPRLKLWADALEKIEQDREGWERVRFDETFDKYFLPFDRSAGKPIPVKSIFVLGDTNTDRFEVLPLKGIDKIESLFDHTYRPRFLSGLGGKKEHFRQCAAIAAKAAVFKIIRPRKGFLLDELMALVESHF